MSDAEDSDPDQYPPIRVGRNVERPGFVVRTALALDGLEIFVCSGSGEEDNDGDADCDGVGDAEGVGESESDTRLAV